MYEAKYIYNLKVKTKYALKWIPSNFIVNMPCFQTLWLMFNEMDVKQIQQ